ncbi:MAG: hypothetical protein AAF330_02535 [Pseudomonadota bacterium]
MTYVSAMFGTFLGAAQVAASQPATAETLGFVGSPDVTVIRSYDYFGALGIDVLAPGYDSVGCLVLGIDETSVIALAGSSFTNTGIAVLRADELDVRDVGGFVCRGEVDAGSTVTMTLSERPS